MLTILSKGETVLLKEQIPQFLVSSDDVTTHTFKNDILHLLNHNLGFSQRDVVNPYQRLLQQRLHDDIVLGLAQFVSGAVLIASFLGYLNAHLLCHVVFIKVCHIPKNYCFTSLYRASPLTLKRYFWRGCRGLSG